MCTCRCATYGQRWNIEFLYFYKTHAEMLWLTQASDSSTNFLANFRIVCIILISFFFLSSWEYKRNCEVKKEWNVSNSANWIFGPHPRSSLSYICFWFMLDIFMFLNLFNMQHTVRKCWKKCDTFSYQMNTKSELHGAKRWCISMKSTIFWYFDNNM